MSHYDCTRCGETMGISPEFCPACLKSDAKTTEEHTGGSSSYYVVDVKSPTTAPEPYKAECNDIIESLDMTFAEANVFKAVWRRAAQRQGRVKKGNNSLYDAEKMVFFSERVLILEKNK